MSNKPNYQSPIPPNNQSNYAQPSEQNPHQGQYQQASYGQNPYQGQYPPAPYGQQGAPYYVPTSIQTDALKHRRASNIAFGIFIVMGFIGFGLLDATTVFHSNTLFNLFLIATGLVWITACCYSVKSKGYSGWVGLVAIFGLLGLLILVLLPNRNKRKY